MSAPFAIVDPFSSGRFLAPEIFKLYSAKPIAIISSDKLPPLYLQTFRQEDFEKIFYLPFDISELETELKKLNINHIIPGTESGVLLAHDLSQKLSLRRNKDQTRDARRDKFEMGEALRKSGIRSVKQACFDQVDLALRWIDENLIYPVILKPRDSAGTQGVEVSNNLLDVKKYFDRYLNKSNFFNQEIKSILVQEKLEGIEYVVDTVSLDGRHELIALWKYKKISANGSLLVYDTMSLVSMNNQVDREVVEYVYSVLNCLGIQNGPAHSELMLTSTGPCLIETGARTHGGNGTLISGRCLGYNQIDRTILAYGSPSKFLGTFHKNYEPKKTAVEVFLISHIKGNFKEVLNIREIESLNSFHSYTWNLRAGEQIEKTVDLITSPGRIILSGSDNDLQHDIEKIRVWEQKAYAINS